MDESVYADYGAVVFFGLAVRGLGAESRFLGGEEVIAVGVVLGRGRGLFQRAKQFFAVF